MSEKEAAPPKPRPSRLKRLFIRLAVITVMVGLVAGLAGYLFADNLRHQDGPHDEAVLVTLDLGDGRFSIKHKLFSAGVISHPLHLDIAAFMAWGGFRPLAGEYRVPPKASLVEIIALFNSGKTYQRRLTIIEGWRGYEVMQAINSAEGLGSVILRPPKRAVFFQIPIIIQKAWTGANYWHECRRKWSLNWRKSGQTDRPVCPINRRKIC